MWKSCFLHLQQTVLQAHAVHAVGSAVLLASQQLHSPQHRCRSLSPACQTGLPLDSQLWLQALGTHCWAQHTARKKTGRRRTLGWKLWVRQCQVGAPRWPLMAAGPEQPSQDIVLSCHHNWWSLAHKTWSAQAATLHKQCSSAETLPDLCCYSPKYDLLALASWIGTPD